MMTKLFEYSEFFVSAGKSHRLIIGYRICSNEQFYENKIEKKLNDYELTIENPIIKIYF